MSTVACLFNGNLRLENRTKDCFDRVVRSIKHTFSNNVDFYMHLWSDDTKEVELYSSSFNNILLESNSIYSTYINNIVSKSIQTGINTSKVIYNQISRIISISKVIKLLKSKNNNYDFIFITRPDLVITEPINLSSLSLDTIYVNKHLDKDEYGDYCWLFTKQHLYVFENILDYLLKEKELDIRIHYWIYNYITKICCCTVKTLNEINVNYGGNAEIYYHLDKHPDIKEKVYKI